MRSTARRLAFALPAAVALLFTHGSAAFADDPWVVAPMGPLAREIQPVYWYLFICAVAVFLIVDGGLVFAALRFRERPGHVPKQFHGHNLLELTWTVIPTLMVISFSVVSFQRLSVINDTTSNTEMTVRAIGRQWSWTYVYPKEDRFRLQSGSYLEGSEVLHIPVGTKVRLELQADDVIHSFWVPQLGGKKDAVPGRATDMWIQADRPGTYKGQCVEFCGDGHADMLIQLVAHPKDEYAAWAQSAIREANLLDDPATRAGRELFRSNACAGCHVIQGLTTGRVGPDLTHVANPELNRDGLAGVLPVNVPAEQLVENLVRWTTDPPAVKPGTAMPKLPLSEADIRAISQFLATRK